MINIKDKLNRTNILIKRTNDVDVEYVSSADFEADIKAINSRIDELNNTDISNFATKSELSEQVNELKREIGKINGAKIDATGFRFGGSTFTEFPDMFYFSNVSDFDGLFSGCKDLTTINVDLDGAAGESTRRHMFDSCISLVEAPEIDTTLTTDMTAMYQNCVSLEKVPSYNIDVCASLNNMFDFCHNLVEVGDFTTYSGNDEDLPELQTLLFMFGHCTLLTTAPHIPTRSVRVFTYMFVNCTSLTTVPSYDATNAYNIKGMFGGCTNLTNFGGLKNLSIDCVDSGLEKCSKLSYDSLINIINGLYNFRANGDNTTTNTIKLNYNSIGLLSDDDIAMATAKGWVISSGY